VLNTERRGSGLRGRRTECKALDRLLADARNNRSVVPVVRGEAGVGKTALLDCLAERAGGFRIARAVGIESEMELAYAGLHELRAPLLDDLEDLPVPHRDAMSTAFGITAGRAAGQILVGLAALSLVSEATEERSLLCIVDDAQWLDGASAQTLGFVAGGYWPSGSCWRSVCATRVASWWDYRSSGGRTSLRRTRGASNATTATPI
jgi:AAA ATPase domain